MIQNHSLTFETIADSVDSTMNDRTMVFKEENIEYELRKDFQDCRPKGQVRIGPRLLVTERRWAGTHTCSMDPCYGCEGDLLVRMLYPPTRKDTASGTVEVNSWVAGNLLCDGCAGCLSLE